MKFKVGDRVTYSDFGNGTIICIDHDGYLGVEFDKILPKEKGHSLYGECQYGYGYWVDADSLSYARKFKGN